MDATPRIIDGLEALAACVGQELACSDWQTVDQSRIDAFANATGDHQWIHVDVERARLESPYGMPIAHGYLTLSMLPALIASCLRIDGIAMAVNYGLDRVRFPAPVPAGRRIRVRVVLASIEPVTGGMQAAWDATVEIEGGERPACVARMLARYYPTTP
ncbi:MaoC family dehydratase [Lysobacter sp. SG-8]|uniref:MaoC family dehydratase n=1 Tax=Marilutibacter penaei TaxID=2759900 RepID=A0A7W3U156_9GAMM|nr:MaoC family dehydratase [Lysobacter penaei]MBB1087012.1 MaoC family dehydratase [Lysobacter penaei]